jgi:hypothetical protein
MIMLIGGAGGQGMRAIAARTLRQNAQCSRVLRVGLGPAGSAFGWRAGSPIAFFCHVMATAPLTACDLARNREMTYPGAVLGALETWQWPCET